MKRPFFSLKDAAMLLGREAIEKVAPDEIRSDVKSPQGIYVRQPRLAEPIKRYDSVSR